MFLIGRWPDGQENAPVGGNFQNASFFTSVRQSSQVYVTRPPWRVAGVDFAIGIAASAFPLKRPGVDALPTGVRAPDGNNQIEVRIDESGDLLLDGWDFSGYQINIDGAGGNHTFTLKNSKFEILSNGGNSQVGLLMSQVTGTPISIVVQNCLFKGNASLYPTNTYGVGINLLDGLPCSLTVTYTAFLDFPSAATRSSSSGNVSLKYNYIEFNIVGSNHAESCAFQCGQYNLFESLYNVIFTKSTSVYATGGVTANIVVFTYTGGRIPLIRHTNNVLISNLNSGNRTSAYLMKTDNQGGGVGGAIVKIQWEYNYTDPTGSFGIWGDNPPTTIEEEIRSHNRSLLDNSIVSS